MNKQQVFNELAKLHWQARDLRKEIYDLEQTGIIDDDINKHPSNYEELVSLHIEKIELLEEVERLMFTLRCVLEKMS